MSNTIVIIITRKKVLKVTLFSNSCLYTSEFTDIQKILIHSWKTQLVRPCMQNVLVIASQNYILKLITVLSLMH